MKFSRRNLLKLAGALPPLRIESGKAESPERTIFRRVNELRAVREAPDLLWSDHLAGCARQHCERKVLLRFPGHQDPQRGGVGERLQAAGYRWGTCGENAFSMTGYENIADFAIVFWWYSLGHQRNMISPTYTHTGVGIARADDGTWYATQIFATPL